jgi:cytoskeletal protein CcmA (bactofilin family)
MAGYIRQSSFVDGDTITAALFNNEYNQLLNAFNNATGHAHDGTAAEGPVIGLIGDAGETSPNNKVLIDTTNNYIEFYVEVSSAPVQQLYISDGAIIPVTDSDVDLGTSSLYFKDAYIDSITTTGNIDVGGNLTVTGTTTFNGGTITMGDAATDNVVFGADINSSIIPNTDDTYDLGSASQEWRNLYIDGTANIDSLVADTADINAGTIDGATIATSDITVGAGKTLNVSAGTLTLADNQISGDKVEGGTIAATTITTLASTTGNITTVNSTTVDSTNLEVTNLKAKDGTAAGSIADTTGVVTLASSVLTTTDINGGTIDGSIIGGTTAAAITGTAITGTSFVIGSADISEAELETIDGVTAGTVAASKAIVVDANKDITGGRNITITGEIDAATLDISGNADIDGTLEADAITINGITLAETIADTVGAMVSSNTETGIAVSYDDADNTLDFVIGADAIVQSMIADDAIDSQHYVDGSIDLVHLSANSVDSDQYVDGSIDLVHMSINSIDSDQYIDGSIDLVHMSANSVDSDQYVDGSIDLIHMSANSVDSDQYVDGSIDTVHLADDAVTGAKLADNIDIAGTLDVTGILTADSNVVVAGNLTVNGTTTTLNTATLDVEDKNITINYGAGDTSASANGAGITIQDAVDASNDATILWDTTNDEFDFSHAINVAGNIAVSGTVDGRDVATDGTKLDGIESSATADQTAAEIRTAVEAATDSNVFTDADHTKLNAIEALADVTDATNVTAAGALMDSELTAIASVKALNQGVATTDSPTFVNVTGTLATAAQTNITSVGTLTALTVDDITINGSTISDASDLTIDVGGDLILDAADSDIILKQNGTSYAQLTRSGNDFRIFNLISDGDLVFRGNDGGVNFTALTLDMSDAGNATFNNHVNVGDGKAFITGASSDFQMYHSSGANVLHTIVSDADMTFKGNDGGSTVTALTLDMSEAGAATFSSTIAGTALYSNTNGNTTTGGNLRIGLTTNNTIKYTAITSTQYAYDTESEGFTLISATAADATANSVVIGGGIDEQNAATVVRIFTGAATTRTGVERLKIDATGNLTFNESGVDADFRVESDTNANGLMLDASTSTVGVNRAAAATVGLSVNATATNSSTYAFEACNSSSNTKFIVRSDGYSGFYKSNNAGGFIHNTDGAITITPDAGGHAVFNEGGVDADFRVESDNNANALFVDGESGMLCIGGASTGSGLGVILKRGLDTNFFEADDGTKKMIAGTDSNNTFVKLGSLSSHPASIIAGNIEMIQCAVAGEVTMPLQPAFYATPSSAQLNMVANDSNVTVGMGTEIFDVGSNFASSTFTAPVTGKYQLNLSLYMTSVDTAASYVAVGIITSNRNYINIVAPKYASDPAYLTQNISTLADMDAGDTAYVYYQQSGGTAQTDVQDDTRGSFFQGYLVA